MQKTWSIFEKRTKNIPYWGEYFEATQISALLDNEEFHIFKKRNGESAEGIEISDSMKWLCIEDRYYPLDLIVYFFPEDDVIVFIDGRRIKVEFGDHAYRGRQCLQELFGPFAYREGKHTFFYRDKNHNTGEPPVWLYDNECVMAFEALGYESPYNEKYYNILFHKEYDYKQTEPDYSNWKKIYAKYRQDMKAFALTDWKQLRYDWEAAMLKYEFKAYDPARRLRRELSNLGRDDNAFKALNSMVLDEATLRVILKNIEENKIPDFSKIFDVKAYTDPFYICNTVRLLEMMGQPDNLMGIDFLFDCLGDIQQPCYDMATELLVTFHNDLLITLLESHFKAALTEKNVLMIAGLLGFAERIHYRLVG